MGRRGKVRDGRVSKTVGWERRQIVLIFGVWLISLVAELSAKCQA